ncbi:unnamed protein product [Medioppia subpectinata]|uniref:Innexin n=1 Tax=Medioppia subpectinata TaxID=1979941 RepID=A0A7R9L626_9ACAR|nr:unnamed protein product [Medioppia subpectinata]CAG2115063.1 unnamed protein product [Medioppia subpectinata]
MISSFSSLLKLIRCRTAYIDESVFRLHSLYTTLLLLFFFVLITTKQLAGEPIDCDSNRGGVKESVLNTYCLIHNTYLIQSGFNDQNLGIFNAYPGVQADKGDDKTYQYYYYQWIWFIFFIEAVFFYTPRWVWKYCESGTMAHILSKSKTYAVERLNYDQISNQSYATKYMSCLILALFNVCFQTLLINYMVGGEFLTYGSNVFNFLRDEPEKRRDEMAKVFPRMAKCTFRKYGSSGSIQTFDALCVLPLNMYNEKIFIFLWFWFILVATLLLGSILVKFALLFSQKCRNLYVKVMFHHNINGYDNLYQKLDFGELIILILIKESKGQLYSREVLQELLELYKRPKCERKDCLKQRYKEREKLEKDMIEKEAMEDKMIKDGIEIV